MAYGFTDVNFDKELSFMKHEEDCYYFFIPQVYLHSFCIFVMHLYGVAPPFALSFGLF